VHAANSAFSINHADIKPAFNATDRHAVPSICMQGSKCPWNQATVGPQAALAARPGRFIFVQLIDSDDPRGVAYQLPHHAQSNNHQHQLDILLAALVTRACKSAFFDMLAQVTVFASQSTF